MIRCKRIDRAEAFFRGTGAGVPKHYPSFDDVMESPKLRNDRAALFALAVLTSPFKSKLRLEAENAVFDIS